VRLLEKDGARDESNPLRLTLYSDYALRILMYLGVRDTEPVTIKEISAAYGISQHDVTKVANRLTQELL